MGGHFVTDVVVVLHFGLAEQVPLVAPLLRVLRVEGYEPSGEMRIPRLAESRQKVRIREATLRCGFASHGVVKGSLRTVRRFGF